MDKESLTFQVFKNSFYNTIGYLWPIFFTLFITPLIVFKLGVKDYGIYLFVNTIIGLLGLLDLGLGTAVTKHMSYYYGKKDHEGVVRLERSANSLFLLIASLGFGIIVLLALGGVHLLPDRFNYYQQYSLLFVISGAMFFLSTLSATCNASFVAIQRFDIWNKISMASITLSSLGMLIAVELGGKLTAIMLVQLSTSFIITAVTFYQVKKIIPLATFGLGWDTKEIKHCYTFGIVTFINNIAASALAYLDRLIIPFFVGPSNLTYYSMPGNIATKIPGSSNIVSVGLFPTVSKLSGGEEMEKIRTLYLRSFRLILIVSGALTITTISFSYKLLLYWLNSDFAEKSAHLLVLLAITNFILSLFGPLSNFLLGLGKLKILSYSSIGMAVFNAIMLLILLPMYGITGAAWAYLISVMPVFYVFYYTETRYLELSGMHGYYFKKLFATIFTGSIIWLINIFLGHLIVSLATVLLIGGVSAILYVLLYKLLGFFEDEDWRDFEHFFTLLLKKIGLHEKKELN